MRKACAMISSQTSIYNGQWGECSVCVWLFHLSPEYKHTHNKIPKNENEEKKTAEETNDELLLPKNRNITSWDKTIDHHR